MSDLGDSYCIGFLLVSHAERLFRRLIWRYIENRREDEILLRMGGPSLKRTPWIGQGLLDQLAPSAMAHLALHDILAFWIVNHAPGAPVFVIKTRFPGMAGGAQASRTKGLVDHWFHPVEASFGFFKKSPKVQN
jgi:hypothetical protein